MYSLSEFDDKDDEESDYQKRELQRLLGTAKNKDRRDIIEKAIVSLDRQSSNPQLLSLNQPSYSNLSFNSYSQGSLSGFSKGQTEVIRPSPHRSRPVSAQRRRPSFSSLDAIPENRSSTLRNLDAETEVTLSLEDIDDICTSSVDNRYSVRSIINNKLTSHSTSSSRLFPTSSSDNNNSNNNNSNATTTLGTTGNSNSNSNSMSSSKGEAISGSTELSPIPYSNEEEEEKMNNGSSGDPLSKSESRNRSSSSSSDAKDAKDRKTKSNSIDVDSDEELIEAFQDQEKSPGLAKGAYFRSITMKKSTDMHTMSGTSSDTMVEEEEEEEDNEESDNDEEQDKQTIVVSKNDNNNNNNNNNSNSSNSGKGRDGFGTKSMDLTKSKATSLHDIDENVFSTLLLERRCWRSTGLSPQFMTVVLREKWIFRTLEIRCQGVDAISVFLDGSHTAVDRINPFYFSLDVRQPSRSALSGIAVRRLTIFFNKSFCDFFVIFSLRIRALPYI